MTDHRDDSEPDSDLDDLELFFEFAENRSRAVRNRLVERHMGLAAHIAKRFSRPGGTEEDLRQVAMLGLVKAIDRLRPELRRALRSVRRQHDRGRAEAAFPRSTAGRCGVPRSAKELHLSVRRATDELVQKEGPLAVRGRDRRLSGLDRDEVLRGLGRDLGLPRRHDPLDRRRRRCRHTARSNRRAGRRRRPATSGTMDVEIVDSLLARLPEREREIVRLRFYEQLSQEQIAAAVGVSQMQVSRLLRASFEKMRQWMESNASE
jgi:RNA polymerase sigma-B factor